LLDPPVLERDLLAERADVDEVVVAVGRVARRPLSHQERSLADGAGDRLGHGHLEEYSRGGRRNATLLPAQARPWPPHAPSPRPPSPSGRCARAPPRSGGSACGSRRAPP